MLVCNISTITTILKLVYLRVYPKVGFIFFYKEMDYKHTRFYVDCTIQTLYTQLLLSTVLTMNNFPKTSSVLQSTVTLFMIGNY